MAGSKLMCNAHGVRAVTQDNHVKKQTLIAT